jgi:MerR family transcriptional regulator, copper efflux regulator
VLISAFAQASGLSRDTVRFYVRRGLLTPLAGSKGGANPYQIFSSEDVQMARTIRMAQSLGFSLREIAALKVEYDGKRMSPSRGAEILRWQLTRLEEKAAHVDAMMRYIKAKLAWVDGGGKGPEPNFTDYEGSVHALEPELPRPEVGKSAAAKRSTRNGKRVHAALSKQKTALANARNASK